MKDIGETMFENRPFKFQQDSAPAHTIENVKLSATVMNFEGGELSSSKVWNVTFDYLKSFLYII